MGLNVSLGPGITAIERPDPGGPIVLDIPDEMSRSMQLKWHPRTFTTHIDFNYDCEDDGHDNDDYDKSNDNNNKDNNNNDNNNDNNDSDNNNDNN